MMIYIILVCVIIAIFSFSSLFVLLVRKNLFHDKIKSFNLKLIISSSCWILFWVLSYNLHVIYERIQNPVIKDGVEQYPGTLGDLVGGFLNPILGFFGILVGGLAFYAQFEANKQVQEQFEKQENKDYKQNFENILFNLINIHHQIVGDIDIRSEKLFHFEDELKQFIKTNNLIHDAYTANLIEDNVYTSRDAFLYFFDYLDYFIWIDMEIKSAEFMQNELNDISKFNEIFSTFYSIGNRDYQITTRLPDIYSTFFNAFSSDFGHYFRNLYRIIKHIDSAEFSKKTLADFKIKYHYTSIVRSQLSDSELKVLFFNCINYHGIEKFKPLLEKYSFFKFINTNEDDTNNIFKHFIKLYHSNAFSPNKNDELLIKYLNNADHDIVKITKSESDKNTET